MTKNQFLETGSKLMLGFVLLLVAIDIAIILSKLYTFVEDHLEKPSFLVAIGGITILCHAAMLRLERLGNKPFWLPILRLTLGFITILSIAAYVYTALMSRNWAILSAVLCGFLYSPIKGWYAKRQKSKLSL